MIFFLLGLSALAFAIGRRGDHPAAPRAVVSGGGPVFPAHPAFPQSAALGLIDACLRTNVMPSPDLVTSAMRDAMTLGRPDVARFLFSVFGPSVQAATELASARNANPPPAPPGHGPVQHASSRAAAPAPASAPAQTVTVSGRSSPIDGVPNERWCELVDALECAPCELETASHVGAYRLRKDRLSELGVTAIAGDKPSQYKALEANLADSYKHLRDSGMLDRVNEFVDVPTERGVEKLPITLSGMLGVVQAAGLEGAVSWMDSAEDRRKFRGTTAQFMRTNGVF